MNHWSNLDEIGREYSLAANNQVQVTPWCLHVVVIVVISCTEQPRYSVCNTIKCKFLIALISDLVQYTGVVDLGVTRPNVILPNFNFKGRQVDISRRLGGNLTSPDFEQMT